MVEMKKALFVTYQPASANSFLVIADALCKLNFDIAVVAANGSRNVWMQRGYKILNDLDDLEYADAIAVLKDVNPTLLIAGTSKVESIEAKFLKAARTLNIKSVSFLDFWNKYRERYYLEKDVVFPDSILVLDTVMQEEMVKLGFPKDIIEVVGSPHLENISRNSKRLIRENKNSNHINVAFFSQPIVNLYGCEKNNETWLGYHEGTILKSLINCLDKISKKNKIKIELAVNLHPREGDGAFLKDVVKKCKNSDSDNLLSVKIERRDSIKMINESDLVLGMTTMVLLESIVMGKPTLSAQINSNGRFKFVPTELKLVEDVYDEGDLFVKLNWLCSQEGMKLAAERENPLRYLYDNATEKFCAACNRLI